MQRVTNAGSKKKKKKRIKAPNIVTISPRNTYDSTFTSCPLLSTIMASGSNPQRQRVQVDDHVDPSKPQKDTPSNTRLANIPRQAVERMCKSLRRIITPTDDDDEILDFLFYVWFDVQKVLEQDPELKKNLASEEEFRDNVTRKGEKNFIDSLRAMAANSDTQGSKAWDDLFEDGTSFYLGLSLIIESSF
jgi:hypothetical protein